MRLPMTGSIRRRFDRFVIHRDIDGLEDDEYILVKTPRAGWFPFGSPGCVTLS